MMQDDDICMGSNAGVLSKILEGGSIEPGAQAGYELCKLIYLFHPLGGKMVDRPIKLAMSEPRTVHVTRGPERRLREAFEREWKAIKADRIIANTARQSRIYGVGAVVMLVDGEPTNEAAEFESLYKKSITFNVLDPMNTAGSIVMNQDPNSADFQKVGNVTVASKPYHHSRCCVMMNEDPIYLAYTPSSFGFAGRSVYQRALYPLKSFIQSMRADDMVTIKAGLLVAFIKQASSIVNNMMQKMSGIKRWMLKRGGNGDVLQVGEHDKIESLDMQNLEKPLDTARNHILANIATAADMPAILLNSETFTRGFGEGTEDAKAVAQYIDDVRKDLQPLYDFFVRIVQYRAWSPEFFEALKNDLPEYKSISWEAAFSSWVNNFDYVWPSSLKEPESEKVKVDETRFKAITEMLTVLLPQLTKDPQNRATLIKWACENANMNENLFADRLELDYEQLEQNPPDATPPGEGNFDELLSERAA
ncbi:anti-CBASS protein Acb1 family protein [Salmonella enterica]|uniref:anti-CBASS protein Acb1 family protein n=1 Tax=Salmonella enterica TaxID=28901 RepID=UPI0015911CE3|nr:anti-CBASS Acb1 family protein [Salmonella enterica]